MNTPEPIALPQPPFEVAHVATECIEIADRTAELLPEELALVERAADKRREQFSSGRVAVQRLLARAGIARMPILRGEGRAPRWPDGWVGSISHGAGYALAALARRDRIAGIGVDVEARGRLNEKMLRLILTPGEIARTSGDLERALVAFSAKESFYKALQPIVGGHIGFQDVEIDLDRDDFTTRAFSARLFAARYMGTRDLGAMVAACRGHAVRARDAVATLVVLHAGDGPR